MYLGNVASDERNIARWPTRLSDATDIFLHKSFIIYITIKQDVKDVFSFTHSLSRLFMLTSVTSFLVSGKQVPVASATPLHCDVSATFSLAHTGSNGCAKKQVSLFCFGFVTYVTRGTTLHLGSANICCEISKQTTGNLGQNSQNLVFLYVGV